ARDELLRLAREDSEAYDDVVAARRLPKESGEEKAAREKKLAAANLRATEVPLSTARSAARLLEALPELAENGNPNAASDVGAAAILLEAAVQGALLNVAINLPGISNARSAEDIRRESETLQVDSSRLRDRVLGLVRKNM